MIHLEERRTDFLREAPSQGGLAGAAQSNERDAIAPAVARRSDFPFETA
jgi:hypothetical protein